MSSTVQEHIDELKGILVDLVHVVKLEANRTFLQENSCAYYKALDSFGAIVTDQQRINELHDIKKHNPLINPFLKSIFESSHLSRGGKRIIDDSSTSKHL